MDLSRIKKYFIYKDRLRVIVSIITGILILIFNAISGFIIIHSFSHLFEIEHTDLWILFLYIVLGMIVGVGVLILCILFIELMLKGIEIEEYSYLRLVLLASVTAYLLVLIFYTIFVMYSAIERKIIPIFSR